MPIDCPDCGSEMLVRQGRFGRFLGCVKFPACRGAVKCDSRGNPVGLPVTAAGRDLRKQAHSVFDTIWKEGIMGRNEAYRWLAGQMGLPVNRCHMQQFTEDQCREVISHCEKLT